MVRKLCYIHPRYTLYSFVLIQAICLNRGSVRELPLVQGIEKGHFAMAADEVGMVALIM